jgi:hypothetical protein
METSKCQYMVRRGRNERQCMKRRMVGYDFCAIHASSRFNNSLIRDNARTPPMTSQAPPTVYYQQSSGMMPMDYPELLHASVSYNLYHQFDRARRRMRNDHNNNNENRIQFEYHYYDPVSDIIGTPPSQFQNSDHDHNSDQNVPSIRMSMERDHNVPTFDYHVPTFDYHVPTFDYHQYQVRTYTPPELRSATKECVICCDEEPKQGYELGCCQFKQFICSECVVNQMINEKVKYIDIEKMPPIQKLCEDMYPCMYCRHEIMFDKNTEDLRQTFIDVMSHKLCDRMNQIMNSYTQ